MELTLRMQEIYFLGKRLNGDHLNYSYIAAMPEISQRRAVIEQECEDALEKCGAVEENLLGELTVRPEAAAFLHPLFFGDYESELMLENTSTHDNIHWVFHREMTEDGPRWLAAEWNGETVRFTSDMERVEAKLQPLLRPGSGAGTELSDAEITDQISEVLLLKNLDADSEPLVILYMMVNGCWYEQTENEKNRPVPPEEFRQEAWNLLQGGENGWHTVI